MRDTESITLHEDEMENHPNNYNGWSREYAQMAVLKALEKMKYEELNTIEFTRYSCAKTDPERAYSEVCFVETKSPGYFFVMRDMVDHINVIYNRWD
ncbi:MAG: hypothetical protein PHW35_15025 [Lentimicrobiaceae bacterium]|jgi:hypothetical protein|nr:hypothetical protein [Lentimicrobiaceae bacterium]MDD4599277.1 hypothetical protein [Lentimicrobiaceae bacterium]MDY0026402.1 hypothetical protein [Lentimicrobium sp.]HAH60133.1 hypothetical protein [Bacteroidales bacterium]